jgi:hypothetical protein
MQFSRFQRCSNLEVILRLILIAKTLRDPSKRFGPNHPLKNTNRRESNTNEAAFLDQNNQRSISERLVFPQQPKNGAGLSETTSIRDSASLRRLNESQMHSCVLQVQRVNLLLTGRPKDRVYGKWSVFFVMGN